MASFSHAQISPIQSLASLSSISPMSYLLRPDPISRIFQDPSAGTLTASPVDVDHFDRLPDSIILLVFNKLADVRSLGRCYAVSRRFHSLVPQVDSVLVRVDCVISEDDDASSVAPFPTPADVSRGSFSTIFRLLFAPIFKPFQALGQFLGTKRSRINRENGDDVSGVADGGVEGVTHHSPTQVLKNFNEIRSLKIELPNGELGIEDGVLLKWRADFGSTLDSCLILGASSITHNNSTKIHDNSSDSTCDNGASDDTGNIPESFYTNGGLKLRVVWTISSLIAASARHYLLQPIITDHETLNSLVLTDADGQGELHMNRDQLEELRSKPLSASSASKRTLVPALNMRLWYAPQLDLPDGTVLKGVTLVAIRPSESKKEVCDASWMSGAFEEPYGTAARMLMKGKTYSLEMNSF